MNSLNSSKKETMLIAIDGVCASGKSSIAKKIAEHYKLEYLNTGKIYRLLALKFFQKYGIDCIKEITESELENRLLTLILDFNDLNLMQYINELSLALESEECGQIASYISKLKKIRESLLNLQRNFAYKDNDGCILDGRDIGSVILPEANFKIFVTADLETRASRRFNQLYQNNQIGTLTKEEIKNNIQKRDEEDMSRENSPLIITQDAFLLDTSLLGLDESAKELIRFIELKKIMAKSSEKQKSNINHENFLFQEE